ncbi:MAG TPA: Asp-tRNA(Asn)/Glu-tRNA(Gln) amidotransferase subunit GatA, partial [Actinomycetaceae bacterium]|nr:Asp-tRNA(Asn)/Glu-tRNA(Gln) amidotransferase subunit GatA [Actinomycetaceae bacterium]
MSAELTAKTAAQLARALHSGEISAREVTQAHLDRIEAVDPQLNAFLHVDAEGALATAADVDERRARGEQLAPLAGVPVALKDVVVTKDVPTTAASKILEGWIPPYDATIVERMRSAGMPVLGKTNLDEFAMGASTEYSAFGPTRNPWDSARTPGGSGGGSAAAVASFTAPLAIGTDTGGSIRQPAAFTGTVGVKPTYGSISRYGVIALASSLDHVGPAARTVLDAAMLHEVVGGQDPRDATSLPGPADGLVAAAQSGDIAGLRIGVINELRSDAYDSGVKRSFEAALELLRGAGAEIVEVSCPNFTYALAAYYLILPAEASSNLAKFDGVGFGLRVEPAEGPVTADRVTAATRGAGFGSEVKRRIILGTYALSAGSYDAYYGNAMRARTLVQQDFANAFEQVDVLVSPTTPTTAFGLGERVADPMSMYITDIATV